MRARSNLPAFPLSLSLSRKGRGDVLSKRHSHQADHCAARQKVLTTPSRCVDNGPRRSERRHMHRITHHATPNTSMQIIAHADFSAAERSRKRVAGREAKVAARPEPKPRRAPKPGSPIR